MADEDAVHPSAANEALELGGEERVVAWRRKGKEHVYRHVFRRPMDADAVRFYRARQRAHEDGRFQTSPEMLELYRELIVRVEGYDHSDPQRVAQGERLVAVNLLTNVRAANAWEGEPDPEHDVVALDALWHDAPSGAMKWSRGLLHRFAPVTKEEEDALQEKLTRAKVVGGSRTGKTLKATRERVLIEFYDAQIRSVDGYSYGGYPVDRHKLPEVMDPFHKVAAVERLLAGALDIELPEAPGEEEETGELEEAE